DCDFPTVDPANPYELTNDERRVMNNLKHAFKESEKLRRHMNFLYTKGGMYTRYNSNLLFHSCVPMNEDGSFAELTIDGTTYSGRSLMHLSESMARQAYMSPKDSAERTYAKDFVWYLWCGPNSPLFGRARMTTFERLLIEDKASWKEPQNPYYDLANDEEICLKILKEFDLNSPHSHIINGHVPVKVKKGESPIKGNGRLLLIDGGFSRAYHNTTGIAGYTLIYNSHGMRIVAHEPFTTTEDAVRNNVDIHSTSNLFESLDKRILEGDTDGGEVNKEKIEDLKMLLKAYRLGVVKPETIRPRAKI
ncbi:MAG: fructose-1,6-bisphosphatase, partial [Ruminococcaceae bacterium]|nr:fructose-1,6-bisphosphatase [Oscillospiraceae bacterium]